MSERQPKFIQGERVQFHNPSYINEKNVGQVGIVLRMDYTWVCGEKSWQYDVQFPNGDKDYGLYEVELRSVETLQ